jgi:hypothetical protein
MEPVPLLALLRNWFARRVLRRNVAPFIDQLPTFDEGAEIGINADKEPTLPPALASELAKRLSAVTPWHVKVDVFVTQRGGVAHKIRSWLWMSSQGGEERGGSRETALLNLLHAVQGYMSEKTKRAWPGDGPSPEFTRVDGPPTRRQAEEHANELLSRLPLPGIAIEDGLVRLWYGDEAQPILELEPIRTGDLPY